MYSRTLLPPSDEHLSTNFQTANIMNRPKLSPLETTNGYSCWFGTSGQSLVCWNCGLFKNTLVVYSFLDREFSILTSIYFLNLCCTLKDYLWNYGLGQVGYRPVFLAICLLKLYMQLLKWLALNCIHEDWSSLHVNLTISTYYTFMSPLQNAVIIF